MLTHWDMALFFILKKPSVKFQQIWWHGGRVLLLSVRKRLTNLISEKIIYEKYFLESQKSGFDEAIGVTRIFMSLHGIWPGFSASKVPIVRYSFIPSAFMIFCFINGPQTIQVFRVNGDLNTILNLLTLANVPIGIALIKLLGVSLNQNGKF